MKITAFACAGILASAQLLLAAPAMSQSYEKTVISLDYSNAHYKTIFHAIEKKAGVVIMFEYTDALKKERVSISVKDKTVAAILDQLLKPQDLQWKIRGNIIRLYKGKNGSVKPTTFSIQTLPAISEPPPEKEISGQVTDSATGQPLTGVTIRVKGSDVGTTTGADGAFNLMIPDNATLEVSYIGYLKKEISFTGESVLHIPLAASMTGLNQLVVVGYGTQKKSDITGSIATIDVDKLVNQPTSDIEGMLRGQVAGLNVTVNDARPGGGSNVLLRGIRSLNGSNSPLYVVDGIPITTSINDLNIDDIQSISVLKDASAQAIYGSRASNGVILITTKRGTNTDNKAHVTYRGYVSYQNVHANFKLYSPEQYEQLRREAYRGDLAEAANEWQGSYPEDDQMFTPLQLQLMQNHGYVNWLDYAFRKNAPLTKHDIAVNGGNQFTQYNLSLDYFDQTGVRDHSGYKKYSGHFNFDQEISKTFKAGLSLYYTVANQQLETSPWLSYITFSPISQLYDSSGNLNEYPTGDGRSVSPLWYAKTSSNVNKITRTFINGYLQITPRFLPGLKYKLTASLDDRGTEGDFFASLINTSYLGTGRARVFIRNNKDYLLENILSYDKVIQGKHRFDVTLVQSIEPNYDITTTSTATQLGNDYFGINSMSSELQSTVDRTEIDRKIVSLVGRLNYAFEDRYLFDFAVRRDGSSVFGANNKWGVFPSVAVAWNVKKESFMQGLTWLDDAKIRVSYGQIGNQAISPYGSLATAENSFYVSDGVTQIGYLPGSGLSNPNLKWETTTTLNTGIDFGLFNDRLTGTLEYYQSNTTDLLVSRKVPSVLGYTSEPSNLGEIRNRGFEATLTGFIVSTKNFSWSVSGNFSTNKNRLVKGVLQDPNNGEYVDDISNDWFIGKPVNVYYDRKVTGIWQIGDDIAHSAQPNARPGDVKVTDVDGDGQITAEDRVIIKRDPNWISSLSSNLGYKGFGLSFSFYIVNGGITHNEFLYDYNHGGRTDGVLNGIVQDYWLPEHPTGTFPRPHVVNFSDYRNSLGYQSTAYVRLKNLTLAYDLPGQWLQTIGLTKVSIYASGDNLWTRTKYQSYSPEEASADAYPETINYTFGMNINF